jgi:hypothetical protein
LSKICAESKFKGLKYRGGPEFDCKRCKKKMVLPCVKYDGEELKNLDPVVLKPACECNKEYDANEFGQVRYRISSYILIEFWAMWELNILNIVCSNLVQCHHYGPSICEILIAGSKEANFCAPRGFEVVVNTEFLLREPDTLYTLLACALERVKIYQPVDLERPPALAFCDPSMWMIQLKCWTADAHMVWGIIDFVFLIFGSTMNVKPSHTQWICDYRLPMNPRESW